MLSLKTKMRIFSGLILLCFLALGVLAINKLEMVSSQSHIIATVWTPRLRAAAEMGIAAREYRISEALRIQSISEDMADQAENDMKVNEALFRSRLETYRSLLQKNEKPDQINEVEELWKKYISGNQQMLAFAQTGQTSDAVGRFRNSASRFYLLSGALDEISAADAEHGSAASHIAANISKKSRTQVTFALISIVLMVGLSLIFFEFKVWSILGRLSALMKRLAANDFEVEIKGVSRRDEIGEMARAVQIFKDNGIEMRRLEAETDLQRKAAEEARQANDKVLAELEEERKFAVSSIARGLDELSQGNMAFRITEAFSPEFQKLKEDFNTMTEGVAALIGHVQKSGIRVSTSVTAIAATSKQQEATASEIAATTTQVGATSKEISATTKELATTMNNVSMVMEQTSTLASSGQAGLSRMEDTMRHVMEAASSINTKLAVLNEKAGNINQVVTTITKVADQTNLLSLNAAIEAEKAGEYGRGFAVVATEIRRLADQTGVATYDIEEMIKEIQSAISAGVMGMDKFSDEVRRGMEQITQVGEQLGQIIHQVQALVPRFEAVDEGMQAQATGAEQICEALLQLTDSAQQTVESLRQSTLAIDELNRVSGGLHKTVSHFKVA